MTLHEGLIIKAMEEAGEVIQRGSKLLRFGLEYIQDGQEKTNSQIFADEVNDLLFVLSLLQERGILKLSVPISAVDVPEKAAKFEYFLELSRARGILDREVGKKEVLG